MPISPRVIELFLERKIQLPSIDYKTLSYAKALAFVDKHFPYSFTNFPPRLHQLQGLAAALDYADGWLLFYSMRLGKTRITLDWADTLRQNGRWAGKGLVIAHASVGLDVWEDEGTKHSTLKIKAVRSTDELLEAIEDNSIDLVVMTWSNIQRIFCMKKRNRKGINKMVPNVSLLEDVAEYFSLCVIDEIHKIKDPEGLYFNMIIPLSSKCVFRLGLTGTPFGRDPMAMWAQFFFLDAGNLLGRNLFFFKSAFGKKEKHWIGRGQQREHMVFDDRKLPILQEWVKARSMSYDFSEVHTAPASPNMVTLHMRGDQAARYKEVMKEASKADLEDHDKQEAFWIRLRQISSGFLPFFDEFGIERVLTFKDNAKRDWVMDQLDASPGTPFIIFHEYTETGRIICSALRDAGISHTWLYGGTKNRGEAIKAFQTGQVQGIVCNTATGGTGVNLNRADWLCFWETPVDPIVRQQAEARPIGERNGRLLITDDLVASAVDRRCLGFVSEGRTMRAAFIKPGNDWASLAREDGIS